MYGTGRERVDAYRSATLTDTRLWEMVQLKGLGNTTGSAMISMIYSNMNQDTGNDDATCTPTHIDDESGHEEEE